MSTQSQSTVGALPDGEDDGTAGAWRLVLAAAGHADAADASGDAVCVRTDEQGRLVTLAVGHPEAQLLWRPGRGWESLLPAAEPSAALVDLYLPLCRATSRRPLTVGHLGQSLDGFIATHEGESQWITGPENLVHMHRLRALCDAVVVGAGTVAADDPRLTTRLVPGASPLRVVFDPFRRLGPHYRVFNDAAVDTIYACGRSRTRADEASFGQAQILGLDDSEEGVDVSQLSQALRARGCQRVFVEGGGVTVSAFLKANLLDRLHVTVAPLFIGDGRPAIRLPSPAALSRCPRPPSRVFRMGPDILFDCDLSFQGDQRFQDLTKAPSSIVRVI